MSSRNDKLFSELITHLTAVRGRRLQSEVTKCKNITYKVSSVRPMKSELEARFWQQISICRDHSHSDRAEHLRAVFDEVLDIVDDQPAWFIDSIHFLLELSPSPLELQHVERRQPFEEILERISYHDDMVLQQGVPGALGDSDSWSSADSIECDFETDSVLNEADFSPPVEQDVIDIGKRDLIPFYTIQDEKTRRVFRAMRNGTISSSSNLPRPIQKFSERMSYLQAWLSKSMTGRSLTFQAFAEAVHEEVNAIRNELAGIERTPKLTILRLTDLLQSRMTMPLKLCHICETITPQPESWIEAVNVLSHLGNEKFFLKAAKPMLLQIQDLLVKGEFHEELPLDQNPQGNVIIRGPLPENMFLYSFADRIKMSAHCAVCYKENTGRPLIDSSHLEAIDIIGGLDCLSRKNIPVQRAAKAAILPLCKLVNTVLVEKLKTEYDAFRVLKQYQYHSFFVSNEMHTFSQMMFDKRCPKEVGEIDRCLEDVVGPEWRVRSLEPLVIKDSLPWPYTIFTCFEDNYVRVRTYIFRVKEAAHALIHWDVRELPPHIRIARFKLMCVMDLLNQHITLTAQECIANADLASGQDMEEITRKHAEWLERTHIRTLMSPNAVRNTVDDLGQTSLKFVKEQDLSLIEKKFIPYLGFLTKAIGTSLPVLAARLTSAKSHF